MANDQRIIVSSYERDEKRAHNWIEHGEDWICLHNSLSNLVATCAANTAGHVAALFAELDVDKKGFITLQAGLFTFHSRATEKHRGFASSLGQDLDPEVSKITKQFFSCVQDSWISTCTTRLWLLSITHTLLKWLIDLLPDWESLINELICLWFGRHSYESNLRQIGLNLNWVLSCCKTAWHPQETYGTIEEAWRKAFDDLTACLPTWANLLAKLSRSKLCTGIESQYLLSSVCSAENVFFFKARWPRGRLLERRSLPKVAKQSALKARNQPDSGVIIIFQTNIFSDVYQVSRFLNWCLKDVCHPFHNLNQQRYQDGKWWGLLHPVQFGGNSDKLFTLLKPEAGRTPGPQSQFNCFLQWCS